MSLEPTVFKLRQNTVMTGRNLKPINVMITGDWHISPIVSEQQEEFISDGIRESNPDVIILQGDLIDSPDELENPESLERLKSQLLLCSLSAPTVLVLGSHDHIVPSHPAVPKTEWALARWKKICKECDVKLLLNSWYVDRNIRIFGAFQDEKYCLKRMRKLNPNRSGLYHHDNPDIFAKTMKNYQSEFDKMSGNKPNWFVAHSPRIGKKVIEMCKNFDVMTFGHTHGGIVPRGLDDIFEKHGWNFGLISPEKTLFPQLARGSFRYDTGTYCIINAGMVGAQNCAPKFAQRMNFIKAAEINVIKVS